MVEEELVRSHCAVAAFVHRGDEVLLVKQQSKDDAVPVWSAPSGRVRVGETLDEAVLRELAEETGLTGSVTGVAYVNQTELNWPDRSELWTAVGFEVRCEDGSTPAADDPDGLVTEAVFVPVDEARRRLEQNPVRALTAPLIDRLTNGAGETTYFAWRIQFGTADGTRVVRTTRIPQSPVRALVVAPYDPAWQQRGADLVAQLRKALGPLALHVEHIGSTSIPGMAAKPVLDLQLSVDDLDVAAAAFDAPLAAFGLIRRPYDHDHVPAGHHDPAQLWVKRLWTTAAPGGERINVHCRLAGSPNERFALLFRDWLRAHPQAIPAYGRFNEVLAASVNDLDRYTDVKDPVVDLVVAVAEQWAAATGWYPHRPGLDTANGSRQER